MTLVEAAEVILGRSKGSKLTAREITDQAVAAGLIQPKSSRPWVHLHSALKQHNRQREDSGAQPTFILFDGRWRLN
jgi:hypothetical protein